MNPDDNFLLGWDEGVMEMTLGEKSVLTIPG
jgi:FKBP-type peptidyl-prolyl cis-trans isomerase